MPTMIETTRRFRMPSRMSMNRTSARARRPAGGPGKFCQWANLAGRLQLVLLELERERADRHVDQLGGAGLDPAGRDQGLGHPAALELLELLRDGPERRADLRGDVHVDNRLRTARGRVGRGAAEWLGEI